MVKALICNEWGIDIHSLQKSAKDLLDSSTLLMLDIEVGDVLQAVIRLTGGANAPVQKHYLKKEQAVAKLKKETNEQRAPDVELNVDDSLLPEAFATFINAERVKVNNPTASRSQGCVRLWRHCAASSRATGNRGKKGEKKLTINDKIIKSLNLMYLQVKTLNMRLDKMTFV